MPRPEPRSVIAVVSQNAAYASAPPLCRAAAVTCQAPEDRQPVGPCTHACPIGQPVASQTVATASSKVTSPRGEPALSRSPVLMATGHCADPVVAEADASAVAALLAPARNLLPSHFTADPSAEPLESCTAGRRWASEPGSAGELRGTVHRPLDL